MDDEINNPRLDICQGKFSFFLFLCGFSSLPAHYTSGAAAILLKRRF